jgi:hypothetical protein
MESVLEQAVTNGAQNLLRQVKTVVPDVPMLTGVPQVRGFRLEGYGLFFDVEVPGLRPPMTWTLRYMFEDSRLATNALMIAQLRSMLAQPQTPTERERLSLLVKKLEESTASIQPATSTVDPALLKDPNEAYTRAVKESLIDAMIESSGPMTIGPDEWLTIAARDNLPRDPLIPGDATDFSTLIIRIKGSDLAAFRAGQINLEEARKRVNVQEH